MKQPDSFAPSPHTVKFGNTVIDGINIFYREAGDPSHPKLVLLHGWPASSHQYRNLMPALADRFHVISPDYPGFGNSDLPDPAKFAYTFDHLSEYTEKFLKEKGFNHYGLFMQDYGGPVGFRIIGRQPQAVQWLTIQNTNSYEIGFSEAWAVLRNALWKDRNPKTEQDAAALLTLDTFKAVYLHGHKRPELISPDNWNMDYHFMERSHSRQAQLDLFYDYRNNVTLYPQWQKYMRDHKPKTIIFWGQNDLFFTPAGGEAFLHDLPDAELVKLDSGHFAVEDNVELIADGMKHFFDTKVAGPVKGK